MRIVKSGAKAPPADDIPCTCTVCRCEFVFRPDDAYSLVEDARDGDYWRVGCPECSVLNSVDCRLRGTAPTVGGDA